LPRIYELKDALVDPSHPDAYFQNFEEGLAEYKSKLNAFLKLERQLGALDHAAWRDVRDRAAVHLVARQRTNGRGWQALFDVFSEVRAYVYLRDIGCTGIHFIPRGKMRTPDLGAVHEGHRLLCEVKTINISQDEAERRRRIYHDSAMLAGKTPLQVSDVFLNKLTDTFHSAVGQLDAADPTHEARRVVFTMLHFDDWVGDYQPEYIAQIDQHLLRNPVGGAGLVFCLGSNLFDRSFVMRSAVILSE
jgi:hypothetical protein